MRNPSLILLFVIVSTCGLLAQTVPQGMKYQAVARDLDGNVLSNESISLQIVLHTSVDEPDQAYSEYHTIVTNDYGLFTITIGNGRVSSGSFEQIPWETRDVFMAVSLYDNVRGEFQLLSDSRLLAVPYAFHAYSADKIVGSGGTRNNFGELREKTPWYLDGNENVNDQIHKLGPWNAADLVVITNDTERMRVEAGGDVVVARGSDLHVIDNLNVGKAVELNQMEGNTHVHGQLIVEQTATLKDNLIVDGESTFNSDITVENGATTTSDRRPVGRRKDKPARAT